MVQFMVHQFLQFLPLSGLIRRGAFPQRREGYPSSTPSIIEGYRGLMDAKRNAANGRTFQTDLKDGEADAGEKKEVPPGENNW